MSQAETKQEEPEAVLIEEIVKKLEERFAALEAKFSPPTKTESKGEAVPVGSTENRYTKIVELLKHGGLKEQWEAPFTLPPSPTASILSFVQQSDAVEGKMGEIVNIPYVKRFNADVLASVGDTLTAKTGIYDVATTTLKEAAFTTQIPYKDIEKLSERLIQRIEEQGQKSIIRAIDGYIASAVQSATGVTTLNKATASANFDADWIAEAITNTGVDVEPQDYMLVLSPNMYLALYQDIVGAQSIAFARPDVVQKGVVQEFMGVTIRVLPKASLPTSSGRVVAVMIHRDAVVFAPKRTMLFETEKDTVARKVNLTGSYTFGVAVVDPAACVAITTPESSS